MDTAQILAVIGSVLVVLAIAWVLLVPPRKHQTLLTEATKAAATEYITNIYLMRNGSMVWHVGHFEFDSVFKVAQFAPPRFEEWKTGWQLHDKAEIYRQYWRGYYADDGETYAMLVGTSDGLWSEYAEAYLGHL